MSLAENVATLPRPRGGNYEFARFNALQHGVLSRHTVLPWEDGNRTTGRRRHIVIFPSRRDEGTWCLRLQYDDGPGRFLKRTWTSAEEAKRWVEGNAQTVTR